MTEQTPSDHDAAARQRREQVHLEISNRLLEELGGEADEHCLSITFHLVRAGRGADRSLIVRFASRAAEIALDHDSYYLAGLYFEAAARAGVGLLPAEECAELYWQSRDALRRWWGREASMDSRKSRLISRKS